MNNAAPARATTEDRAKAVIRPTYSFRRSDVALINRNVARRQKLAFNDGACSFEIESRIAGLPPGPFHRVNLLSGADNISLSIPEDTVESILARLEKSVDFAVLDAAAMGWLFVYVFWGLIDRIEAFTKTTIEIKSVERRNDISEIDSIFFSVGWNDLRIPIAMKGDPRALDRALSMWEFDRWIPAPVAQLAMPVNIIFGWTDLTISDILDIRSGDVILVDRCLGSRDRAVCVICDSLFVSGRLNDSVFKSEIYASEADFKSKWFPEMSTHLNPDTDEIAVIPLSPQHRNLPVTMSFEFFRTNIALADLCAMNSNYVFELPFSEVPAVNIFANGLLIGKGEIVRVEEVLGVRVTTLVPSATS
ncbi:MAG: type secretion system YscQ/HrcQ family protein [Hyphomicrobiales bacterium]|nr:type secretion system YscQ/HrcQ family protein [Hyphomicrobiales bacterium]